MTVHVISLKRGDDNIEQRIIRLEGTLGGLMVQTPTQDRRPYNIGIKPSWKEGVLSFPSIKDHWRIISLSKIKSLLGQT